MAGPAPATITFNMPIHVTAPSGTDAYAIARLVRRHVDEASRSAAARVAALYDTGDGL